MRRQCAALILRVREFGSVKVERLDFLPTEGTPVLPPF
jgi:hypothetical protein